MLTPQPLNAKDWYGSRVHVSDIEAIPQTPGIYLLIHAGWGGIPDKVLYVGMSQNLFSRVKHHPLIRKCIAPFEDLYVYFSECSSGLRPIEIGLIRTFNPPYNIIGKPTP